MIYPDPEVVIYHGGCWDGFAAAMIARRAVNEGRLGQLPEPALIPGWYGMPIPDEVDGKHVMVTDFSFSAEQMVEIAERAETVVWLDHHKTAVEAIRESDALDAFELAGGVDGTDLTRSAAMLTWDWFHWQAEAPWLVAYIEDRDLWRKALPDHEAVLMWIRSHEMTAETWEKMLRSGRGAAAAEGAAMHVYHERLVANAAENAFVALFEAAGVEMPLAACSYDLGSDVAGLLINSTGYDLAGYVLHNRHGAIQYGFRSSPDVDVSEIAKIYGGGGHAQAAGCKSDDGRPLHRWVGTVET